MNHAPQIHSRLEIFDKNGVLREEIINNEHIIKDYKVQMTVKNHDGSIASDESIPFRSFVDNFSHLYNGTLFGVVNTTLIKTTTNAAITDPAKTCKVVNAAADDTHGIVVGLNTTIGANHLANIQTLTQRSDYSLKNKISHGIVAGTLDHGATTADDYSTGNPQFSITRTFVNSSGAIMTVGEVGIVGKDVGTGTPVFMLCRDTQSYANAVIATVVGIGQTLEVKYTFTVGSNGVIGAAQTLQHNWLSLIRSDMIGAACTFVTTVGAQPSIDMSTNPTFKTAICAANDADYGVLLAINLTGTTGIYYANNKLIETYGVNGSGVTKTVPLPVALTGTDDTVSPGWRGVTPQNVFGAAIGVSRDFKNISVNSDLVADQTGLFIAGSGTGARIMLLSVKFAQVKLATLETLRVTLYIVFPTRVDA